MSAFAMEVDIVSIFQSYEYTCSLLHRETLSLSFKAYKKTCHCLPYKATWYRDIVNSQEQRAVNMCRNMRHLWVIILQYALAEVSRKGIYLNDVG